MRAGQAPLTGRRARADQRARECAMGQPEWSREEEMGGRLVEAGAATGGVPGLGVAGLFCGGVLGGGVVRAPGRVAGAGLARRCALSARGSMSTPDTESTVVTVATLFETLLESKSIVMMRAVT